MDPTEPEIHIPKVRMVVDAQQESRKQEADFEKITLRRKSSHVPPRMTIETRKRSALRCIVRSSLQEPPEKAEQSPEEKEVIRLETAVREDLKALYQRQLNVGKGMQRGPFIVPYRAIGTPDLKRDDSLLPKTFQFAKRENFPTAQPVVQNVPKPGNQPMALPLELRAAYWNGGRWCGRKSTAKQVAAESGFKYLYKEVVESEKRRVNCRGGKYFLSTLHTPRDLDSGNVTERSEGKRSSVVSEFTPRQKTEKPSMAKPYIPPLPLKDLPRYDLDEQLHFNQEIISAYRDESTYRERLAAAERETSPELDMKPETDLERKRKALFGTNGFPLKACEDSSLRQLGDILHSRASFRALQHDMNTKLLNSLRALQTYRPYHYAREYKLKGGGGSGRRQKICCDPDATPRRAKALRRYMDKCRWFEDLLDLAYENGRRPSETELFIIDDVRGVLDLGTEFGLEEFTSLIQRLGKKKLKMNSPEAEKALMHMQTALKLDDLDLLMNLIASRSKLPAYLERKTNLVKQVIRDLTPNRYPQSQWADLSKLRKQFSNYRPKTPESYKFRRLSEQRRSSWQCQTTRF